MGKHSRSVQKRGPQNTHKTIQYPTYSSDEDVYEAKTIGVKKSDENLIGLFHNHEGQIPELLIPSPSPSNASSTTSHYEYPVFADGHTYDYNTKKKHREEGAQGHLRAITNQKGKLKGVIAHEGNSPQKKPHVGPMHWVPEKKYNETDKYLKDKEKSEKK